MLNAALSPVSHILSSELVRIETGINVQKALG